MGKKKVAQDMQEVGAETFLAPVKASVSAPKSEVSSIQEIKSADKNKRKELLTELLKAFFEVKA
jgi:hypothetical protein